MLLPIVIDTDIGDDIDDAYALALALTSPEVELLGVSTVWGPVETRTRLALNLLNVFGRPDIPVSTGRSHALDGRTREVEPAQAVVLVQAGELPSPSPLSPTEMFLAGLEEADGQLVIISIGALTNVAVALTEAAELATQCRFVVMGGAATLERAEYNVACDPEAAAAVFSSGADVTMVGLDVTLRCQLTQRDLDTLNGRTDVRARLLAGMTKPWLDGGAPLPVLHDPLAVAAAFAPSFVTMRESGLRVETEGEVRGRTVMEAPFASPVKVCLEVEAERFVRFFVERVINP